MPNPNDQSSHHVVVKPDNAGLKFPGFNIEWPITWASTVAFAILAFLVLGILYIVFHAPQQSLQNVVNAVNSINAGNYNSGGSKSGISVQTIYKIWTPDANTKLDLLKLPDYTNWSLEDIKTKKPYYWVDSDNRQIDDWITKLRQHHVAGFSYWEANGSATTGLKRGLIWELTINNDYPMSRKELIDIYSDFWQRTNNIYIEEFSIPNSHEND